MWDIRWVHYWLAQLNSTQWYNLIFLTRGEHLLGFALRENKNIIQSYPPSELKEKGAWGAAVAQLNT